MTRVGLTEAQYNVLRFIQNHHDEMGYGPSFQEMADALGYANKSAIYRLLKGLKERGYVRHFEGSARSIVVLVDLDGGDTVPALKAEISRLKDEVNRLKAELNVARA